MPQVCLTCQHPKRNQIEWDIIKGVSLMAISRKYGISWDSLFNHSKTHLKQKLIDKAKKQEFAHQQKILDWLEEHLSTKPQVEFNKLVNAAYDLNQTMGLNPPIDTKGPKALKDGIRKAMELVEQGDVFKESTKTVLQQFIDDKTPHDNVGKGTGWVRAVHEEHDGMDWLGKGRIGRDEHNRPEVLGRNLQVGNDASENADQMENYDSPSNHTIPSENSDPAWLRAWRKNNPSGPL